MSDQYFFGVRTIRQIMSPSHLRMQRHSDSTMKIAKRLDFHPTVEYLRHPRPNSRRQHEIAKKEVENWSNRNQIAIIYVNLA